MGLINWIFDIYQHSKIEDAHREAALARKEIAEVRNRSGGVESERLVQALGELALATKTLQRMLIEKGVCTHAELDARLRQIDHEDGVTDGRAPI